MATVHEDDRRAGAEFAPACDPAFVLEVVAACDFVQMFEDLRFAAGVH
jgi:hypothetical protein